MSLTEKQKMEAYLNRSLTDEEFEKERYLLFLRQAAREKEKKADRNFNIAMGLMLFTVFAAVTALIFLAGGDITCP